MVLLVVFVNAKIEGVLGLKNITLVIEG